MNNKLSGCKKRHGGTLGIWYLVLVAMLLCLTPAALYAQDESVSTMVVDAAPVAPFGDTLFFVYGSSGAVTAENRANIVAENITLLSNDPFFNADSLKIIVQGDNYNIVYNKKVIVAVAVEQAQYLNRPQSELAKTYCANIANTIEKKQNSSTWLFVLLRIGAGLLFGAVAFFVIKYLNLLHHKMRVFVRKQKDKTIKKLHYIFDASTQIRVVLLLLNGIRWLLIILTLYACLLSLFRIIPATQWLYDTLLGYVLSPIKTVGMAVWDYIPHLFSIVIIVVIFRFVIKTVGIVAKRVSDGTIVIKGFYPDWAKATFNIIRTVLVVFMIIFISPHIPNADSTAFQGISVFVGLLLSLGSTSFIGNLIAGLVITYMRPFHVGDRIRVGETFGDVLEKTSLVTRIKTTKNELITIPNSIILSAQTINYTSSAQTHGLVLHSKFAMSYDISWRKVHELLIEAGCKTPYVLQDPKPFVLQLALDDFYVQYEINVYIDQADKITEIYSDLNQNIQDVFNREGIELLAPHTYEHRAANSVAIPKEYVTPATAKAPSFKVEVTK